ncbi:MAG: hypothetical protein Q9220_006419 [cf. Caloplaca sp. 1 TL-2023]
MASIDKSSLTSHEELKTWVDFGGCRNPDLATDVVLDKYYAPTFERIDKLLGRHLKTEPILTLRFWTQIANLADIDRTTHTDTVLRTVLDDLRSCTKIRTVSEALGTGTLDKKKEEDETLRFANNVEFFISNAVGHQKEGEALEKVNKATANEDALHFREGKYNQDFQGFSQGLPCTLGWTGTTLTSLTAGAAMTKRMLE